MRIEIKQLQERLGTTSVYVTHDQVEAMTLAQRMIVMNEGRAEQVGTPLGVYAKPATTFVAGFIGSPAMNLIPEEHDGRKVLFGIRPEHLEPCARGDAKFEIDVDLIEPLGADTLVYGHLEGASQTRVAARLHSSVDARTGKLPLRYDPARVHWFDPQSGKRIEA
jgi:sn-glycerol 3-phosphate transport system ATP-binding protein